MSLRFFCLDCLLLLGFCVQLYARQINNHHWRYSVDLPADWLPESGNDGSRRQTFSSANRRLGLEIIAWNRRQVEGLRAMYRQHLAELGGQGVVSRFLYLGYEVLLARIDYRSQKPWPAGSGPGDAAAALAEPLVRVEQAEQFDGQIGRELEGRLELEDAVVEQELKSPDATSQPEQTAATVAYVFYFYGAQYAYRLSSVAAGDTTAPERDIQYSVLDSFGFEGHDIWNPGPLASFFIEQKPPAAKFVDWYIGDAAFQIAADAVQEAVLEQLLARERRILLATMPRLYPYALARFYRQLFRSNYAYLRSLAQQLQKNYRQRAAQPNYEHLLYDLQMMQESQNSQNSAETSRAATGGSVPRDVAIELPAAALARGEGSIETLALLYVLLNAHFGNNSLILYSPLYAQLVVGVEKLRIDRAKLGQKYDDLHDTKYQGITVSWYQNRYLIGELSARIYIGWARTPMRDLQSWIPVAFPRYVLPGFFP